MDAMKLLLERASALKLEAPGPSAEELDTILKTALRAPDHGRLRPWHFVVVEGEKRERFGELMAECLKARDPKAAPEALAREKQKAMRAPVIIIAAAAIKPSEKIPAVEQVLSAGAAVQNIMLATQAMGYGAMWRTGPIAYDARLKEGLGLKAADAIVGVIYIGRPAAMPSEAGRPQLEGFVTRWSG